MSSAMVYGLLPLFLVRVLHSSLASVGLIEGMAEAANSLMKIASGFATDRLGRRKPIVLVGYLLSAIDKLLFPLAHSVATVLAARLIDRLGKGIRDAPRDALLTDVTPESARGSGFGLRLAFYTAGFVAGPLTAVAIMRLSHDDFRLVFWLAVIPAALAIVVLLMALKEPPRLRDGIARQNYRRGGPVHFPVRFWWAVTIAGLLSTARLSQAFLVLKANDIGIDPAFAPFTLVIMHLIYAGAAYPFGVLADRMDRRLQLEIGVGVLIAAYIVLANAGTLPTVVVGAALWGLQLAVTQGLLSAAIAEASPEHLRGRAFGFYELAVGTTAFVANFAAGSLWELGGPVLAFGAGASIAGLTGIVLLLRQMPRTTGGTEVSQITGDKVEYR
jgi:MFS family permease